MQINQTFFDPRNITKFIFLSAVTCCLALAASAQTYSVTDLGTLGGDNSEALAINNSGKVAGMAAGPDNTSHPFLYSGGVMTDLTGAFGVATGINASGEVTGFAQLPRTNNTHAFLYSKGVVHDLGTLPDPGDKFPGSEAFAINKSGEVVGDSSPTGGMTYQDGKMRAVGHHVTNIYALNDDGDFAGMLATNQAFLIDDGKFIKLGSLDGSADAVSAANGINNLEQVVGYSFFSGNAVQHAFLYENGRMLDLGTLQGGYSVANGINNKGDIVGESDGSGFLYRNGTMIDLSSAMVDVNGTGCIVMSRARAINDAGQIVGLAGCSTGAHAVLLTPIQ